MRYFIRDKKMREKKKESYWSCKIEKARRELTKFNNNMSFV
jgi:hypothetical protein